MSAPELTPEEIAAIEARADAATPGPWLIMRDESRDPDMAIEIAADGVETICVVAEDIKSASPQPAARPHDAAFIAHAREDVPALLAALAHMTKIAEAERALRVAPLMEAHAARAKLRALGVEP